MRTAKKTQQNVLKHVSYKMGTKTAELKLWMWKQWKAQNFEVFESVSYITVM